MANNPPNNSSNQNKFVEQFLINQQEELKIKAQELELRKQTDANNYEYAQSTLAAQERYLNLKAKYSLTQTTRRYIFIGILAAVILFFVGIALYLNKDQIVMELIKAAIYIIASGGGGYFYGRYSCIEQKDMAEKSNPVSTQ